MTHPRIPRVLIVDDEFSLVETLAEILVWEGYEVSTAPDGLQGLVQAEAEPPALILLDHMMPVLNGLDTMTRIRATSWGADLPLIFMTAAPLKIPPERQRGVTLLRKPFEVQQLLRVVKQAIGPGQKGSTAPG